MGNGTFFGLKSCSSSVRRSPKYCHSFTGSPFDILKICLTDERENIYKRIDNRVDKMIESGLLDEAKAMYKYRNLKSLQTIGYKEFFEYFEGKRSKIEAINEIKKNSRRYAKRQITWFKGHDYLQIDINSLNTINEQIKRFTLNH